MSWLLGARDLARERGIEFVIALAPVGLVDPNYAEFWGPWPRYMSFPKQREIMHRVLRAELEAKDVTVVDLEDDLKGVPGTYRLSDGHWTELGTEIAAKRLAAALSKMQEFLAKTSRSDRVVVSLMLGYSPPLSQVVSWFEHGAYDQPRSGRVGSCAPAISTYLPSQACTVDTMKLSGPRIRPRQLGDDRSVSARRRAQRAAARCDADELARDPAAALGGVRGIELQAILRIGLLDQQPTVLGADYLTRRL